MQSKLQTILDTLRAQQPSAVADLLNSPAYGQNNHQGLYEIRDPSDSETIYIGKTRSAKEGVAQRIWDHAKGISGLLTTLSVTANQFGDYRVRTLSVEDARLRGLAEYFAIAVLDPPGNLVA